MTLALLKQVMFINFLPHKTMFIKFLNTAVCVEEVDEALVST